MSVEFIRRLRRIEDKFIAVCEAVRFFSANWQKHPNLKASSRDFKLADDNLEKTYIIRLFAEFEGILKEHLETSAPGVKMPDKPGAEWLISRVMRVQTPPFYKKTS
jgi:hypothetical protein